VSTANLLVLALFVAMVVFWTLMIRHHHRKTMRGAKKLAELERTGHDSDQSPP